MEIFKHYSWPGNFRELRNIIRRATLLAQGNIISINVLPSELMFENLTHTSSKSMAGSTDLKAIAERTEKEMILKTLESVNYNKSKAALLLNIDRKTLYNKIKQYNIRLGSE